MFSTKLRILSKFLAGTETFFSRNFILNIPQGAQGCSSAV